MPDRPFNGYRVAARIHPWCSEWSDSETHDLVCKMAPTEGEQIPNCTKLATAGYTHPTRMYCSDWKLPAWCREGRDFYDFIPVAKGGVMFAPTDADTGVPKDVIYFGSHPPTAAPVYGIQCEITQVGFERLSD